MDQAERIMGGRPDSRDPSLEDLVRQARAGEEVAFRQLVQRVFPRVQRWALTRTGDADEADDVTQTVLVRLYRHLDSYSGKGGFDTWLYRITANAANTVVTARVRRERRLRLLSGREATGEGRVGGPPAGTRTPDVLHRIHEQQVLQLVRSCFRELPDRQREVFDLVDLQGHAPAEVAEMLQMNPATVRANLFKARRAIRTRVLEAQPELE